MVAPASVGKSVACETVVEAAPLEVFEAAEEALDVVDDAAALLDVLVDLTNDETPVSLSVVGAAVV